MLCPPQLNAAAAAQASYSGWKAAAGRYQRVMQSFTSALQDAGLGRWLRKPPELGHFYSSQEQNQTLPGASGAKKAAEDRVGDDTRC